jgi:hypothetical protein
MFRVRDHDSLSKELSLYSMSLIDCLGGGIRRDAWGW